MRPRRLVALAFALPLATVGPAAAVAATLQPKLPDLTGIVKDPKWAVVLGKALFWDVSVGSDGMACASCHFHAGADVRMKNALSPGLIELPDSDTTFGATVALPPFALGATASGGTVDSTYTLDEDDFPFHQLADILDRNSALNVTTNDVVSSAGAVDATFTRIRLRGPFDSCDEVNGDVFHAGAFAARQVEPRNTPTMINAVFNHRNFWDGRAMNDFSGVGVFGQADVLNNPASAPGRPAERQPAAHLPQPARREPRVAGGRAAALQSRDVMRRARLPQHRPQAVRRAGPGALAAESPSAGQRVRCARAVRRSARRPAPGPRDHPQLPQPGAAGVREQMVERPRPLPHHRCRRSGPGAGARLYPDGAELLHVLGHRDHALRGDPDLGRQPVRSGRAERRGATRPDPVQQRAATLRRRLLGSATFCRSARRRPSSRPIRRSPRSRP